MTLNHSDLFCIDISDVHMGHDNTPTENIAHRLRKSLTEVIKNNKTDYLFVSGDFFDQLLNLPSFPVKVIQGFIAWLLQTCKKHNIKLRVLEGTPSHDWKQNYLFLQINQDSEINADVRYYDKLSIDTEEDGLTVLYVPDEWDESTLETQNQVETLLQTHGLKEVDLAIMHGMFHFQVPSHLENRLPLHNQAYYESIVKHLIIIGHDHKHKSKGKVVVPGSFDRIAHGEEDPKGFLTFKLKRKGKPDITFVENTEAEIYRSIELGNKTAEESLQEIDRIIKTLPINSKVRLVYQSSNPIQAYTRELIQKYPEIIFSKPKLIKEEETLEIKTVLQQEYTAIILNEENILDKLLAEVKLQNTDINLEESKRIIEETLDRLK